MNIEATRRKMNYLRYQMPEIYKNNNGAFRLSLAEVKNVHSIKIKAHN